MKSETHQNALKSTTSWNNFHDINKKVSVGTLSTSKYHERAQIFESMNEKAKNHSSILPLKNYFGQMPDPLKDPYDRRRVKQLNDISFEESEGEEEFEDTKHLKRLPQSVLTEETLRSYVSSETQKLNLEHHYWIKDTFLDKVGRMAPNLIELSLRRLKISNKAFTAIALELRHLKIVDFSDCEYVYAMGVRLLLENNRGLIEI